MTAKKHTGPCASPLRFAPRIAPVGETATRRRIVARIVLFLSCWLGSGGISRGQYVFPAELVRAGGLFDDLSIVRPSATSNRNCSLSWVQLPAGQVTITRRERPDAQSAWGMQLQPLRVSYTITGIDFRVAGDQLDELYLSGVHDSGIAIVERWKFSYGQVVPGAPCVPIQDRPLPVVQRTALLTTATHGTIRGLAVDPLGRHLLFLTYETPRLFKLALPSKQVTQLHDTASLPALAGKGTIGIHRHRAEGRITVLTNRQAYQRKDAGAANPYVLLKDGNDDGVIDQVVVLASDAEWCAAGYDQRDAWLEW